MVGYQIAAKWILTSSPHDDFLSIVMSVTAQTLMYNSVICIGLCVVPVGVLKSAGVSLRREFICLFLCAPRGGR